MHHLGSETALIYIIDRNFLECLKVLHYSLYKTGSLQQCPVVVVTDDRVVAEDPFIKGISHSIELISEEELAQFAVIRGDLIAAKLSTNFAPKYTFLKLLFFRNRGFKRHIFIDADILCMNPVDEALLAGPAQFKAVREFGANSFPLPGEPSGPDKMERSMAYIEDHCVPKMLDIRGINSGFMCAEGEALRPDIIDIALKAATERAFPNEQSLTTESIRRTGASYLRLPIWYNARRRLFASMGEDYFRENQEKVVFFHYTPGKPWKMRPQERKIWDDIWFDVKEESEGWVNDMASRML